MRVPQKGRLGQRVLRRGARGDDVVRLQSRLDEMGYRVGANDGVYGYLLEDAVRALQREHRLRPDGIAGAQVVALLRDPELNRRRRVHAVRPQEQLTEIAQAYGVSVPALSLMNRLAPGRRLYAGQRLVIRNRIILGALHPERIRHGLAWLGRQAELVSAVVAMWWRLDASGALVADETELPWDRLAELGVPVWAGVHSWHLDGSPTGGAIGLHGRRRRRLLEAVRELVRDGRIQGLLYDIGPLKLGDGGALESAAAATAAFLKRPERPVYVVVPAERRGWFDDLDPAALARSATRLVLGAHHVGGPGQSVAATERMIARMSRRVHPWRLLAGVPAPAYERIGDVWLPRDYAGGMASAYLKRRRPHWDAERLALHAEGVHESLREDGEVESLPWELFVENSETFRRRLLHLELYNLDGLFMWRLGEDDPRAATHIPRIVRVHR
ncbi:MAG TPA: peptidoglycan-binding protein [Limnochordia bacterium]|nr:peptidoglycan-binding protein [Limnochordia bacterium]